MDFLLKFGQIFETFFLKTQLDMLKIDKSCSDDDLFYKVFHNIVLFRLILKYVRLYNKNEKKSFYGRTSLIIFQEREYIQKIFFCKFNENHELEIGDLPNYSNSILKEIELSGCSITNGEIIPNGVEILTLGIKDDSNIKTLTPPLSTLPSTIHTVNNVIFAENKYTRDKKCPFEYSVIPPNIKSISFITCYDISSDNGFTIPHTITSLSFNGKWSCWDNTGLQLRINDIPSCITKLHLCQYDIKKLNNGSILPNSIKDLSITLNESNCYKKIPDYQIGIFDFLLKLDKIEQLYIKCFNCISIESNLNKCKSINKLIIESYGITFPIPFKPFSLPSNITELSLIKVGEKLFDKGNQGIIPNSVTNLKLSFSDLHTSSNMKIPNTIKSLKLNRYITKVNILPDSLTHLSFPKEFFYNSKYLIAMLKILPTSLTSIKFPKSFKTHKSYVDFTKFSQITLQPNIKKINFTKEYH